MGTIVELPTATTRDPFEALFMEHYGFVCRTLACFGVAQAAVDDVAQEVFLVLHRRLPEFDRSRDLRGWLWGIARRVAHTHQRSAARAERRQQQVDPPEAPPVPERELDLRERAAIVSDFVAALPDKLRDVFVLADIEGLTAPEIAAALEIKLNTVYSRMRLARERFAQTVAALKAREAGPTLVAVRRHADD